MLPEQILSLYGSSSDNSIKHPYVVYTIISLLAINLILIVYLSYKLFSLCSKKVKSNFEKKNRRYRVLIFILIFQSLLLRAAFEGDQIYSTLYYDTTTHMKPLVLIIDALPSLLFVSISCVFCYFWYELYSSFEDSSETVEQRVNRKKTILVTINLILYLAFIVCSIFHLINDNKVFAVAMRIMCALSLIYSIIMLKVHGSRLYNRALRLISYNGRIAKTSGFRVMYVILLCCCVLKLIKEAIIIYFSISVGEDLLQDLDNIQEGYHISIFILYVIVFYVFGEYGLLFSLTLMLNSYANKSKVSFTGNDDNKVLHEEDLLENDSFAYTATHSRVIPVHHLEGGEVSVTFV